MKTIVCEEPFKWNIITRKKPVCKDGEAIIHIRRIGICGTDIHAFSGNQPYFTYPRVLGHELAGTVVEVAANPHVKVGDQVTIIPYLECGECPACRAGKTNCCSSLSVIGVHQDGGMTEYISVPVDHLIVTNQLTLDETVIIEPLSISAHAVRRAGLSDGEKVLVIGAGPIGLGVMAFAKLTGATVIAMDMNQERLTFSERMIGVAGTVRPHENLVDDLRTLFNGQLPETVFDATGNVNSMNASFQYPEQGGKLVFVGLVQDAITFSDPEFHRKELTLMSSRNATKTDFLNAKQALEQKTIDASLFITHRCRFEELPNAFAEWLRPEAKVIKAVIENE